MSMTDIEKLEKIIKEQNKQIDSLKMAISGLQRKLIAVSKKTDRTYEISRRNVNDINTIKHLVRK